MRLLLDESLPRRLGRLLTADRSLVYQQSLPRYEISVLVLRARTNRLQDLVPLVPRALEVLPTLQPGQSAEIS